MVAKCCRLVAIDLINIFGEDRLFILILSPNNAPPVFRRVGSTAKTAIRISGLFLENLSKSSSTTLLLPAPPVPVIPITGVSQIDSFHLVFNSFSISVGITLFSMAEIV